MTPYGAMAQAARVESILDQAISDLSLEAIEIKHSINRHMLYYAHNNRPHDASWVRAQQSDIDAIKQKIDELEKQKRDANYNYWQAHDSMIRMTGRALYRYNF